MSQEAFIPAALGAKFAAMTEAQPSTVADSVLHAPESVVVDPEKTYIHTLEDGREVAGTLEQTRMLCPVIGAMSVESAQATLDDADFARRMAEKGRLRREASEQERQSGDKLSNQARSAVEAKEAKPTPQKQTKTVLATKTSAKIPTPPIQAQAAPELRRVLPNPEAARAVQAAVHNTAKAIAQRGTMATKSMGKAVGAMDSRPTRSSVKDTAVKINPKKREVTAVVPTKATKSVELESLSDPARAEKDHRKIASAVPTQKTVSQSTLKAASRVQKNVISTSAQVPAPTSSHNLITKSIAITSQDTGDSPRKSEYIASNPYALYLPEVNAVNNASVEAYSTGNEVVTDIMFNSPFETILDEAPLQAVDTLAQPEMQQYFDDEIMQVYEQLLILTDGESEIEEASLNNDGVLTRPTTGVSEQNTIEASPAMTPVTPLEEIVQTPTFEAFILLQPKPEKSIEFEEIVAGASEQTLEETFVQVCSYLAEVDAYPADSPLHQALSDLAAILPLKNSLARPQETHVFPTPGMTEKLLILLKTIGYPHPHEALVACIKKYGWEFLTQALAQLYKISLIDNTKEFFSATPSLGTLQTVRRWNTTSIALVITRLLLNPHVEILPI